MQACRPWLEAELALLHPRGVVLLGGTAGKALGGEERQASYDALVADLRLALDGD